MNDRHDSNTPVRDRGGILVMVLVTGVIASLFVLPVLYYITTVVRANSVTSNKIEAIELAEGATWIALNNQGDLFDMCGTEPILSSLDDVSTTCEVLSIEALRDPADVPFDAATIQADAALPAGVGVNPYANPNTSTDPGAWLAAPDASSVPTAGTVWLPELPVRPAGNGGERDKLMQPGAQDPNYASCRVFFPGTFTSPITIDEPAYFVSGVYYFTQPITLQAGADVVAGPGAEVGCSNDFEAPAGVIGGPPIPLGTSGLGATFVFGEGARLAIDDDGSDDIRFAMNPRYVGATEDSVEASAGVSIISVVGDHGPSSTPGDPLQVPGVIDVPASTVGVPGTPLAVDQGYGASTLTPKPGPPAAPAVTATVSHQRDQSGGAVDRGRLTVFWDAPAANGSPITGYTATDSVSGRSCSPAATPGYEIQTSCTIDGLTNQSQSSGLHPVISVTATNDAGTSDPSASVDADRLDLGGSDQVPEIDLPDAPTDVEAVVHIDGIVVEWSEPSTDGGSPITGYTVTVEALEGGAVTSCNAAWNERACVAPVPALVDSGGNPIDLGPLLGDPDDVDDLFDIRVAAVQTEGDPGVEFVGDVEDVDDSDLSTSFDPAPVLTPAPVSLSARTAILDFSIEHAANVDVKIGGYVAVPAGRIALSAASPSTSSIELFGGLLAGAIDVDPAGAPAFDVRFDNPIGQKRIRLTSTTSGSFTVTSTAIVQVNGSGSIAINSWTVQ